MSAPDFPLTPAMLTAIIQVMRIDNERMQQALHDHLVLGHAQADVAARYGYDRQQLNVHIKRIREKLKPAFDSYAAAILDSDGRRSAMIANNGEGSAVAKATEQVKEKRRDTPSLKAYAVELDGIYVVMVAATSKKAAAALIGTTTYMMSRWEGGMNEQDEALALASPGIVFRKRIVGDTEWEHVPAGR